MDAETFDSIISEVQAGAALRTVIRDKQVAAGTFYAALTGDQSLAERYARARMSSLDAMADDILGIADDEGLTPESRRVRCDARKWLLSKLAPKKYGDKLDVAHSGNVTVQSVDYSKVIDVTPYDTDSMSPMRVIDSKDSSES